MLTVVRIRWVAVLTAWWQFRWRRLLLLLMMLRSSCRVSDDRAIERSIIGRIEASIMTSWGALWSGSLVMIVHPRRRA